MVYGAVGKDPKWFEQFNSKWQRLFDEKPSDFDGFLHQNALRFHRIFFEKSLSLILELKCPNRFGSFPINPYPSVITPPPCYRSGKNKGGGYNWRLSETSQNFPPAADFWYKIRGFRRFRSPTDENFDICCSKIEFLPSETALSIEFCHSNRQFVSACGQNLQL